MMSCNHLGHRARATSAVVVALLCGGLVGGAGAAEPRERTVTRAYTGSGGLTVSDYPGVFLQDASPTDSGESVGGALFSPDPERNERWFRITAADVSGQPVAVRVFWTRPNEHELGPPRTFCSGQTPPLRTNPSGFVQTFLVAGPCDGGASLPTRGEISITLGAVRPAR